ncbi:hypothetical protein DH2020_020295 [Rehmannia glutinosa]|uniref:Uncharacterized protein n=1 Tax=Rehmannia glutinosa TaxID=99300 RepID=A0ABR0WHT6_REHGL
MLNLAPPCVDGMRKRMILVPGPETKTLKAIAMEKPSESSCYPLFLNLLSESTMFCQNREHQEEIVGFHKCKLLRSYSDPILLCKTEHGCSRENVSPDKSDFFSVSMDESMSTCDSLKSPDVEYMDSNEIAAVDSIERKASNMFCISKHQQSAIVGAKEDLMSINMVSLLLEDADDKVMCSFGCDKDVREMPKVLDGVLDACGFAQCSVGDVLACADIMAMMVVSVHKGLGLAHTMSEVTWCTALMAGSSTNGRFTTAIADGCWTVSKDLVVIRGVMCKVCDGWLAVTTRHMPADVGSLRHLASRGIATFSPVGAINCIT